MQADTGLPGPCCVSIDQKMFKRRRLDRGFGRVKRLSVRTPSRTLYRQVQQHAASFITHNEACTGAGLPRFIKDGLDTFFDRETSWLAGSLALIS